MSSGQVTLEVPVERILHEFETRSGLEGVDYEVKDRPEGQALVLRMANPTERFFKVLEDIRANIFDDIPPTSTIKQRTPPNRLQSPESRYFLRTISESLNIGRFSFKDDFFARYTKSVSNAEAQITAGANHIVYGRRGAGKSSLLLYAMRSREARKQPSAWVDMQAYEKRPGNKVVVDVIFEIVRQLEPLLGRAPRFVDTLTALHRLTEHANLTDDQIQHFLPEVRGLFAALQVEARDLFIFLDDFHVLDLSVQPKLLAFVYSITRGSNVFLKISAIETLTKPWDARHRIGLQAHDAQTIKLDYDLTMPDKAAKHIEGILDAHAIYCGLPSVRFLCTDSDVLSRLVWVCAGVPRDALNVFGQAMIRGASTGRSRVSMTNVNVAASEMVSQKMRDLETDVPTAADETDLESVLERVKDFCIKQERKNAFLVEIRSDNALYQTVLKLVDLRLLHVISEGITVGEAGKKYLALILDYGFYTGIRAAQSVDLFNRQTERVAYKDLRRLPVFRM